MMDVVVCQDAGQAAIHRLRADAGGAAFSPAGRLRDPGGRQARLPDHQEGG